MFTKDQLARDPDVLVIGETTGKECRAVVEAIESGAPVITYAYADLALYRKGELAASGLAHSNPAMYEVCAGIIGNDAKARLPRGIERRIPAPRQNGCFTYESPRTHQF